MNPARPPLWRSFPWDPAAAEGAPFSAAFVPASQGRGRFDLPGRPAGVLYLAETPDHALGEWLARFRGQNITPADLERNGAARALVRVEVADDVRGDVIDLCDPAELLRFQIHPDELAHRDRAVTQPIAERLFDAGHNGLRWWSAHFGEWHTVVLFRDRLAGDAVTFGAPQVVDRSTLALARAADWLNVTLAPA